MDNRYYDKVVEEMQPFFDEQGFKECEDQSFKCATKAVKIEYSEERQMYLLKIADIEEEKQTDFTEVSSWLFDDSQTAKDAESVGVDFTATLRENMGIKIKRSTNISDIDLPTASKSGSVTVTGFTKKVLDVFPQYKDEYKEHIAKYGNFLYIDFFSATLVPQIREMLKAGGKKNIKKIYELLENGYVQGDKDTVNIIVACVSAAVSGDETLIAAANSMLESDKHFQSAVTAFIPVVSSNKKLSAALIKSNKTVINGGN